MKLKSHTLTLVGVNIPKISIGAAHHFERWENLEEEEALIIQAFLNLNLVIMFVFVRLITSLLVFVCLCTFCRW